MPFSLTFRLLLRVVCCQCAGYLRQTSPRVLACERSNITFISFPCGDGLWSVHIIFNTFSFSFITPQLAVCLKKLHQTRSTTLALYVLCTLIEIYVGPEHSCKKLEFLKKRSILPLYTGWSRDVAANSDGLT